MLATLRCGQHRACLGQSLATEDFVVDFAGLDVPESFDFDGVFSELDEPLSDEPLSDELDDEASSELLDESDEPGGVVAFDPRLSVLKKPDPLKVTPTGWKTFLTESTSPDSG